MSSSAKLNAESFVALIRQSRLVDPDLLRKILTELKERQFDTNDVGAIADELVSRNVLTRWQTEKLLQRKHKGFFLGKYRLLSHLGSGGISAVYLAEHILMRRRVAIKVLPAARVDDSSYLERFHREAQAVAALDHRNIVRAYDVDQEGKVHFLVMEYVPGQSLHELVVTKGKVDYIPAVEYMRQAAEGLQHAHRMGLVHRDVKPGNLLLDEKGTIKLLDLGLARYFAEGEESSLTIKHDEKVLGTADFLSPEQALNSHNVDIRSDIYSLGCTLYYLLTAHPPFPDGTLAQRLLAHQTRQPEPIRKDRPDISESLVAILEKMMAKKPDDRYSTAKDAAAAMQQWLTENGGETWAKMNTGLTSAGPLLAGAGSAAPSSSNVIMSDRGLQPPGGQAGAAGSAAFPSSGPSWSVPSTNAPGRSFTVAETAARAQAEPELAAFLSHLAAEHSGPISGSGRQIAPARDESVNVPRTAEPAFPPGPANRLAPTIVATSEAGVSPAVDQAAPTTAWPQSQADFDRSKSASTAPEFEPTIIGADFETTPTPTPANAAPAAGARKPPAPTRMLVAPPRKPASRTPPAESAAPAMFSWRQLDKRIVAGGAALLAVLLSVGAYLAFGPAKTSSTATVSSAKSAATPDHPGDSKKKTAPRKSPVRREWKVGPSGDFATIGAALADVRKTVTENRRSTQIIKVAGGQIYAERIVIDGTFPRGIQIIAEAGPPPVLAPSGSEPIVALRGGKDQVEDFRLEGFRLEAGGKDVAVQLAQWVPGANLKRLEISGFERAGVLMDGSQTFGAERERIVLEDVTFRGAGPDAVGISFQKSAEDPMHIRILRCRFLAPLAAGVRIDCSSIDIEIAESIFYRVGTGIRMEGADRTWRDVVLAFNTFFENEQGLVLTNMPGPATSGLGFFNNLFFGSKTADAVIQQGFDPAAFIPMYRTTPGGTAYNWTTRPKLDAASNEIIGLFEAAHCRVGADDVQFRSVDPESADFLAPAAGSPHRQAGTTLDQRRFGKQIGAVRAK